MLSYGNNTYAYTANGELTAKTDTTTGKVTTYNYDVLGNLKHVNLPDGTAIDYVIDGRNRRIAKKVNGALTEAYLYDGQLRPIAELDASGNVVSRFVYATHINVPDYMVKGGVTYKIITDHLGSPRFVIDSSTGTIAQRMDYDDFGNVLLDTAPGFTPFGFAGGLYDNQTKLIRFGARDYDAESGRWTSKDSLYLSALSSNLFAYTFNDPVSYVDPRGRQPLGPLFLIGLLLWDSFESLLAPEGEEEVGVPRASCSGGYNCHNTQVSWPPPRPAEACMLPKFHPNDPRYQSSPYGWKMMPSHGQPDLKQPHEPEEAPEITPPRLDPLPGWGQPPQPPPPPKI
jgi:RHS repeat-associated protein